MPARSDHPQILVIDDAPPTLSLLTAYLVSDGYEVITARDLDEAARTPPRRFPDLILLDLLHPAKDRFEACRRIKASAAGRRTPVVVSVDARTLADRQELREVGADDFITKPYQRMELLLRVDSMLRMRSLRDELQAKTIELKSAKTLLRRQAITDPLTGLYNKGYLESFVQRQLCRARRRGVTLSLVTVAVHGLGKLNHGQGHREGDRLLQWVANVLRSHRQETGLGARYGDKRFVLVLPDTDSGLAREVAADLCSRIASKPPGAPPGVVLEVGVATHSGDVDGDTSGLLCSAERSRLATGHEISRPAVAAPPGPVELGHREKTASALDPPAAQGTVR